MWIYPLKIVIFHSYVNVYQRVTHHYELTMSSPTLSLATLAASPWESMIFARDVRKGSLNSS